MSRILASALLPEFDQEAQKTRTTLERVPTDKFAWKPHEKSMTLGRLAGHLAEIPFWAQPALNQDELDIAPPGLPAPFQAAVIDSLGDALDMFDRNVAASREALAAATDEDLAQTWSLLNGGKTVFTMSRYEVLRNMVFNHLVHHRAQLGVYLRLNDISVPSVYGPSADEGRM